MQGTDDVMDLTPGSRWRSAVCESEIVVVRAPAQPVLLCIGGAAVLAAGPDRPVAGAPGQALADGTLVGKRYTDETSGLEVLCTKSGVGTITVAGRRAVIMSPRSLPASD
jgi:hypothetical protein